MRKMILFFLFLLFACNHKQTVELVWHEGFPQDFSLSDKIFLVDFYSEDCSPCQRLAKETFTNIKVSKFCRTNFQCYKINAWAEQNKSIQEGNRVYEIPTLIFFNNKGEEIERLTGFMPPEQFLQEITRITKGTDTYLSLKHKVASDPGNLESVYQLALKEARIGRKGDEPSQQMWQKLVAVSEPQSETCYFALANYYTGILWKFENPDSLLQLLENMGDYEFKVDGFQSIIDFLQYKNEKEKELKYFRDYADYVLQNKDKFPVGKTLEFLNSYANRMTELNTNLDNAMVKIDYVISNLPDTISNLDRAEKLHTKALIHLALGENDKALVLIDNCIALLPDNAYLKEKKAEIEKK